MRRTGAFGVVIFAAVLSGCTPMLIAANDAGGMVSHADGIAPDSRSAAFRVADAHCKTLGKVARVTGNDPWSSTMTFDCVKATSPSP